MFFVFDIESLNLMYSFYDVITDNLFLSVNYYDDYGRPIRIVSDNHHGKTDVAYTNYNFAGEITETTTIHNHGQSNQVKLATTYAYDHQGRLLSEKMKINDGTEITLSSYQYNELGEQIARYLHGSSSGSDFNQKVDYMYNIKGWLRKQNQTTSLGTDLFAQELKYQDSGNPSSFFNGNIWQTSWRNSGDIAKNYIFSYDGINRLEDAVYSDGVNNGDFDTGYAYDANGNISTLSRKASGNPIDVLTYSYLNGGNRLQTVTDAGTTEGYHAVAGNYGYDVNGNMVTDPSKGTTIEYNYLNLPKNVEFGANDNLRYTYDAAGNKLVKVVDGTVAGNNTRLDYSGNFVYENDELKAIFTSAGRIIPFDNNGNIVYKFEYNLQDHLGNTRVVFSGHSNGQPEVMQVTDYYPFGLVMNQQNYFASGVLSNKYLYNGKELQDDELAGNSLGWYDYGFRFYDATLARFTTIDPLTEKNHSQSGFAYAYNNPVRFIDYMGLDTIGINYNDKGIWEITNSQIVEGNDVFRVTRDGETTMHTFSEGEYGARINVLNLENNEDYTLGIYHISGAKGEGSVGYAVTPGGAPSTSEESGQRLPDDVYTITPTYSHEKYWVQPLIAVGEKNGNVSGRGVKFHPAPSSLFETRVRQWTDGCYVVSTDYSVRGGQIYYNSNNSLITSKQFNTFLGATNHYDRVGKKSYPGSDFQNGIIFKLIQKSGF